MTIQDFSTFIKKYSPGCIFRINLAELSGQRIAVDGDYLVYVMITTAAKQVLGQTNLIEGEPDMKKVEQLALKKILDRLCIFLYYRIEVVCCFDSAPSPLKERVQENRSSTYLKRHNDLETARLSLYSVDPLFRNSTLTEKYAKAFQSSVRPSWEFMKTVRNVLGSLGFPVYRARDFLTLTGDAEGLAACLCYNGHCLAALTTDSDFHPYGGNICITEIKSEIQTSHDGSRRTDYYAIVRSLNHILSGLGCTFETFRDICIMLGTDYNNRIPGVGPVNIYKAIQQHGSLANYSQIKDVSCYDYYNVSQIFSQGQTLITPPVLNFNWTQFQIYGRQVLEDEGLHSIVKVISDLAPGKINIELPPILETSFNI